VPAKPDRSQLLSRRWVHVFEQDTAKGAVYLPANGDVPLSRRPREWLELLPNGDARVLLPGPDDRLQEQPATWTEDGDAVVVRAAAGGRTYRVIEWSPDRLIVRR
jgi:hypothetical protein